MPDDFSSSAKTPALTVLLVEDYPVGMLVSTLMIEFLGYKVETAESGQQAIEKVRGATQPFMVILMDIQMHGMDGLEATKLIRVLEHEKGFYSPIIAVTAHGLAGDRRRCIEAGMNDYISKPIHPEILTQKLAVLAAKAAA